MYVKRCPQLIAALTSLPRRVLNHGHDDEQPTRVRFHVVDRLGRRSSSWLVAVGGSARSDVYIGPDGMMGGFKVSLHESGYCQFGPTDVMRAKLSWRFRAAMSKWQHDSKARVPTPALRVHFYASHLLEGTAPPPEDSIALEIGDAVSGAIIVALIQRRRSIKAKSLRPISLFSRLRLSGDRELLLLRVDLPESAISGELDEVRAFDPGTVTKLPNGLMNSDYAYGVATSDTCCDIYELAPSVAGSWENGDLVTEDASQSTTEEFVMESLQKAQQHVSEAVEELSGRGPVWDGTDLLDPATSIAGAVMMSLQALANVRHLSVQDGQDLADHEGLNEEMRATLSLAHLFAGSPCADPECPDHTVGAI